MRMGIILALLGLIVAAVLTYESLGHSTPKGQAHLADLTQANLDNFERDFNQAEDSIRVLALLSPT